MLKCLTSARDDLRRTARHRPKRREQAGLGAAPFGGAFPVHPQVGPLGFLRPQAARELQKQEDAVTTPHAVLDVIRSAAKAVVAKHVSAA
jgi:hypothetical protein